MLSPSSLIAYVGCRTTAERRAKGRGLVVYAIDGSSTWAQLQVVSGLRNPSYLCSHPALPVLYAVHGDFSEVSTFAIAQDGTLQKLAEQSTCGVNPVHLAVSPSLRWLLVANYASGNVVSMKIGASGELGAVSHTLAFEGSRGPHTPQDGSHPHQVCFSPDGRYALVPDKGLDSVFSVALSERTGVLQAVARSPMERGRGPRHLAFHPTQPLAYIVGELDRTIVTAAYEPTTGRLHPIAERSTVPADVKTGSAAGVVLSGDARRLYVSNRGHDSVVTFPVAADGTLGDAAWMHAGRTPRFICEPPDGHALLVAREDDHSIAVSSPDQLSFVDVANTGSPVCVVFRKTP